MYNFEKLDVYRRADIMGDIIRDLTVSFPKHETYVLGDQMRRAADSVASNIAEGGRGDSNKEMIMFLRYALGSNNELYARVGKAIKLGYLRENDGEKILKELVEIGKMISGLIRWFRKMGRKI